MRYLDTNIFVRALARDNPEMTAASEALFARLEGGSETAFVAEAVVAEAVFVLTSPRLYRQSKPVVVDGLTSLLSLDGVQMEDKRRCLSALGLFSQFPSLDFVDALLAAMALRDPIGEVVSFDGKIGMTNARVVQP